MLEIIVELKSAVDKIILTNLTKIKVIEIRLMEIIQFYLKNKNVEIRKNLEIRRRNLEDLRNLINIYRIPPIILKEKQNEINTFVQIKVILFYFELISIEIEKSREVFLNGLDNIGNKQGVSTILEEFSITFFRVKSLFKQLEEFGNIAKYENVFDIVWPGIKEIYSEQEDLEKIIDISEKTNFKELENFINSKGQISQEESVVLNVLKKGSQYSLKKKKLIEIKKKKLIEIINTLVESDEIKKLGGIVSINKLYNLIKKREKNLDFTLPELNSTLKFMKKRGHISDIEKLSNIIIIKLYPIELSDDPKLLLDVVEEVGIETKEGLLKKLNWSEIRLNTVIDFLIEKGICKMSENSMMGIKLYFPGIK